MTNIIDTYKTVISLGKGEYSEKRSKFLAFAFHVETEEEIKAFVQEYRKKYFDARHVCYAYILDPDAGRTRANDDGEPSGSAGRPILGQIRSAELTNTLVIVVRYYGGVNLGTGGLVVAYKTATASALEAAVIEERIVCEHIYVKAPYEDVDPVLQRLKAMQAEVITRDYDATHTTLTISVKQSQKLLLMEKLRKIYTIEVLEEL